MRMLADVGIPTALVFWPLMAIWFCAAAVFAETLIVACIIHRPYRSVLWPVYKANLISTLIGVPILFALIFGVVCSTGGYTKTPIQEFFTTMAVLSESEHMAAQFWAIQTLGALCLVLSIVIEYRYLRGQLHEGDAKPILTAVVLANLASYSIWFGFFLFFGFSG